MNFNYLTQQQIFDVPGVKLSTAGIAVKTLECRDLWAYIEQVITGELNDLEKGVNRFYHGVGWKFREVISK